MAFPRLKYASTGLLAALRAGSRLGRRPGKKGSAVLIVPFPRRRRVEGMLRGARIEADWIAAPTPDVIRAADRGRLMEKLLAPVEADEEDREIAREILEKVSAEDLAAALVRAHRAAMVQVLQDLQALLDDGVAFLALDVGDETDAAGVMFVLGVVQALGGRQTDAARIDGGRLGRETGFDLGVLGHGALRSRPAS